MNIGEKNFLIRRESEIIPRSRDQSWINPGSILDQSGINQLLRIDSKNFCQYLIPHLDIVALIEATNPATEDPFLFFSW